MSKKKQRSKYFRHTQVLTVVMLGACGGDAIALQEKGGDDAGSLAREDASVVSIAPGTPIDLDGDGTTDGLAVDANGDGILEGVDTNNDGVADEPLPTNSQGATTGGSMGGTTGASSGTTGGGTSMGGTSGGTTGGTSGGTSTGGTTGGTSNSCEQASHFLDVAKGSAGGTYAKPTLSVTCSANTVTVKSNGIPNFEFDQVTPNALTTQTLTYNFPRNPSPAAQTTSVPLVGSVAVAVNGLPIFGPTEAPNDGSKDPYLEMILDYCNGHTAPGGIYHFHARPDCLFKDMEGNTHLVVAYAFDGYPILAPYVCTDDTCTATKEVQSGWKRKAGSSISGAAWDIHEYVGGGDLDQCNGKTLPDGSYAYYATDTFPYFIGCYKGTPTKNR